MSANERKDPIGVNSGLFVSAEWVTIAVLGRTHANRGEITAMAMTSKPDRFEGLREAYLFGPAGEGQRVEIESVWEHGGRLVFKFAGIDNISDAEIWQGAELRVPLAQRAPLDEGEFYYSDLVGCEVWDRKAGDRLGIVAAMQEFGGPSGVLELDNGLLIPFAKAICVNIDPAARRIDVELPEGLRELNQP
jgi:16S rRNA processing protein RimM